MCAASQYRVNVLERSVDRESGEKKTSTTVSEYHIQACDFAVFLDSVEIFCGKSQTFPTFGYEKMPIEFPWGQNKFVARDDAPPVMYGCSYQHHTRAIGWQSHSAAFTQRRELVSPIPVGWVALN